MDSRALETEALVLRRFDTGEADRVVWLLTPGRGRLSAFAAAARRSQRRFAGALEPFTRVTVQLTPPGRGELWRLLEAQVIDSHSRLRDSLEAVASASVAAELIGDLAPENSAPPSPDSPAARAGHYEILLAYLRTLATRPHDPNDLYRLVYLALQASGMRPRFGVCARCGDVSPGLESARESFDPAEGGRLCATCPPRSPGAVRVAPSLLTALGTTFGEVGDGGGEVPRAGRELIWGYAQHQLGRPLKSLGLLGELGL